MVAGRRANNDRANSYWMEGFRAKSCIEGKVSEQRVVYWREGFRAKGCIGGKVSEQRVVIEGKVSEQRGVLEGRF